jgi:CubicO group peptidase (beta-lactamase class C family)
MKRKILTSAVVLVAIAGMLVWPRVSNTIDLANAGTAYVAKALCSGVLVAGLDPDRLLAEELSLAAGLITAEIDYESQEVYASAVGGLISGRARRQPGRGCSLYDGDQPPVALPAFDRQPSVDPPVTASAWPIAPFATEEPPAGVDQAALARALDEAFSEPDPDEPRRTRAVVVVHQGWVVAERYAEGITAKTPLIGWSMTKSLTHALMGIATREGILSIDQRPAVPEWAAPDDPRSAITFDHLLRMSSGLDFEEVYTDFTSDAVRMLMRARDAGAVAAGMPLGAAPDTLWKYSSGTSNIISRALRAAIADDSAYWSFPRKHLFDPLGMTSAFIETDPSGTFVGSSYSYATARDWARFGLLYLTDGLWGEQRILPEGWVDYGVTPTPAAPDQRYGAHWWLNAGERFEGVPADEFRASGFDGQWVMVIPSRQTVIVRLGQTPGEGFDSAAFERAVLGAFPVSGEVNG